MLMILGQRFEESLICFWLVILVTVLFFFICYFYSEGVIPLCVHICTYIIHTARIYMYIHDCVHGYVGVSIGIEYVCVEDLEKWYKVLRIAQWTDNE